MKNPPTANMQQLEKHNQPLPPVTHLLKTVTCKCNSFITHLMWIYHLYLSISSLCREKFSIEECRLIVGAVVVSFHSASMLHVLLLHLLRLPLLSALHYLLPANTFLTKTLFTHWLMFDSSALFLMSFTQQPNSFTHYIYGFFIPISLLELLIISN